MEVMSAIKQTGKSMSTMVCPACGSSFFTSDRSRNSGWVFRLNHKADVQLLATSGDGPSEEFRLEELEALFCGACSWKGDVLQLNESLE